MGLLTRGSSDDKADPLSMYDSLSAVMGMSYKGWSMKAATKLKSNSANALEAWVNGGTQMVKWRYPLHALEVSSLVAHGKELLAECSSKLYRKVVFIEFITCIVQVMQIYSRSLDYIKSKIKKTVSQSDDIYKLTTKIAELETLVEEHVNIYKTSQTLTDEIKALITSHCDKVDAMWKINRDRFYIKDLHHWKKLYAQLYIELYVIDPETSNAQNEEKKNLPQNFLIIATVVVRVIAAVLAFCWNLR